MAIVWDQKIKLPINNRNRTKFKNNEFLIDEEGKEYVVVSPKYLAKSCRSEVSYVCDHCQTQYQSRFSYCNKSKNHFCSKICSDKYKSGKRGSRTREWINTTCKYCAKKIERPPYNVKSSGNIFCSKECTDNYRKGIPNTKVMVIKCIMSCANCNKAIARTKNRIKNHSNQFCSHRCSSEFSTGKEKKNTRTGTYVNCHMCSTKFYLPPYRVENYERNFCGNKCRTSWMKSLEYRTLASDIASQRPSSKIERKCSTCGKTIYKWNSEIGGEDSYCSMKCNMIAFKNKNPNPPKEKIDVRCENCNTEFKVFESIFKKNKWHFCSTDCYHNKRRDLVDYPITMTRPHISVNSLLEEIGISFVNEFRVKRWAIDIMITKQNLAIEIMGDYWHGLPSRYNDFSELNNVQTKNINSDRLKKEYINNELNIPILYLWETDINNDLEKCRHIIDHFVHNNGMLNNYHSYNYLVRNGDLKLKDKLLMSYQDSSLVG